MTGMATDTDSKSLRRATLRDALAQAPATDLKAAIARAAQPDFQPPNAVRNALAALHRRHDPAALLGQPQYRPTLPYLAAALAGQCLHDTIDALGDNADDPTRDQLLEALDAVRDRHSDATVAIMLADAANDDLPASDLCLDIVTTDPRYGIAGPAGGGVQVTEG